jgi:predicted enzyme related to lactoylglutathione lyase
MTDPDAAPAPAPDPAETAAATAGAAPAPRLGRLHPHNVVIDCADHDVVVPFWEAALGWRSQRINDQFVGLRAPADEAIGFDILFQKVPEPKQGKNRAHIDFDAADMDAEVERLVGLGGTKLAEHNLGAFRWTIVADPEGNEFCVTVR